MGNACDSVEFEPANGSSTPVTETIDESSYNACGFTPSPNILTTTIINTAINCTNMNVCDLIYDISIGNNIKFRVVYKATGFTYIVDPQNPPSGNVAPKFPSQSQTDNPLSFDIILLEGTTSDPHSVGDTYGFIGRSNFNFVPNRMHFFRDPALNLVTTAGSQPVVLNSFTLNKEIQVPAILVQSQTLIDASDIGNTTFKIIDNTEYYFHKPVIIHNHICTIEKINSKDMKITNFEKYCPKGVEVLRGEGSTAYEKVVFLFESNEFDIFIQQFGINLIKYAMVKYLLARILYGKFDMKYVLQKYNDKILRDLSKTRFCHFVDFFTDPNSEVYGYNQYFL